jgi:hypothetical protein
MEAASSSEMYAPTYRLYHNMNLHSRENLNPHTKRKVDPDPKHYAIKLIQRTRSNFSTRRRRVVTFTLRLLYSRTNNLGTKWTGGWNAPTDCLDGEGRNSASIELQSFSSRLLLLLRIVAIEGLTSE